jgi:cytoskeletal protein RodZ
MKRTGHRFSNYENSNRAYSNCLAIAILGCAFLVSSELPLLAQSSTAAEQESSLPDAPVSQSAQTPSTEQAAPPPSGTAGAKAAAVKGAPAAQPAGAAVAPERQRGHRSLLIKVGLVAGAAVAVGSVVALSQGKNQARPPGAASSTRAIYPIYP